MTNRWYEIKAKAESSEADVYLYDEIGGWGVSAKDFISDIKKLSGSAIALHIHSPGGSILDGHAIYNALLRHKGGLTVQVDGLAASMASVVAMAGQTVRMAENAFLMIHNPWSVAMGESEDMRKTADLLDKMRDGIVNIYAQKTGMEEEEIEEMMDAETWLTAEEAKEKGFVDEITDRLEIAASFDLKSFGKVPNALLRVDNSQLAMTTEPNEIDKLAAAQEQARKNFADMQAVIAERDSLNSKLSELSAELTEAKLARENAISELATFQAKDVERLNAEATRVLAASGHPPVNIGSGESAGNPIGDAALYEQFKNASPAEATRMLNSPESGPRIRAHSAKLHSKNQQ